MTAEVMDRLCLSSEVSYMDYPRILYGRGNLGIHRMLSTTIDSRRSFPRDIALLFAEVKPFAMPTDRKSVV